MSNIDLTSGIGMGIDPGYSRNIYDAAKAPTATEILQKMRAMQVMQEQIEYQKRANMNVTPMQMIAMRLFRNAKEGHKVHPFQHMDAFVDEHVAVVFIIHNNKPVTIEDDVYLFPSDSLITQLRLLIG
jgi:hypothetical protein